AGHRGESRGRRGRLDPAGLASHSSRRTAPTRARAARGGGEQRERAQRRRAAVRAGTRVPQHPRRHGRQRCRRRSRRRRRSRTRSRRGSRGPRSRAGPRGRPALPVRQSWMPRGDHRPGRPRQRCPFDPPGRRGRGHRRAAGARRCRERGGAGDLRPRRSHAGASAGRGGQSARPRDRRALGRGRGGVGALVRVLRPRAAQLAGSRKARYGCRRGAMGRRPLGAGCRRARTGHAVRRTGDRRGPRAPGARTSRGDRRGEAVSTLAPASASTVTATAPPSPARRRPPRGRRVRYALTIAVFLLPSLIPLLAFVIGPMVSAAWTSLHSWNLIGPMEWVGLDNYAHLLTDPQTGAAFVHTVYYLVGYLPLVYVGG